MSVQVTSDFNEGIMSQAMIQIMASTDETFFVMQQPCRHHGGRVSGLLLLVFDF